LVPLTAGVAEGAAGGFAGAADEPEGVAALLVWANAEIAKRAAIARRSRRNLLVMRLLELLGTWLRE
jgi:hypothetical protein